MRDYISDSPDSPETDYANYRPDNRVWRACRNSRYACAAALAFCIAFWALAIWMGVVAVWK